MKKAFKISAVVLTLIVLIAATVAIAVSAAPTELTDPTQILTAMRDKGAFELTADFTVEEGVELGSDITLDLKGHVLRINSEPGAFHSSRQAGIDSRFKIIDTVGGGAVITNGPLFEVRSGTVNIEGGTIIIGQDKPVAAPGCEVTVLVSGHGEEAGKPEGTTWTSFNPNTNIVNNEGYVLEHFWGYKADEAEHEANSRFDAEGAVYQILPKVYTISYVDGNGVALPESIYNSANPVRRTIDTPKVTLVDANAPQGFRFGGWSYVGQGGTVDLTQIDQGALLYNIEFIGQFDAIEYNITYKGLNGAEVSGNPTSFKVTDNTIVLNNPTKNGADFKGWFTEPQGQGAKIETIDCANTFNNMELWAHFVETEYSITYVLNGATVAGGSSLVTSYTVSSEVSFPMVEKRGYAFVAWHLDSTEGEVTTGVKVGTTGNLTVVAEFAPITYNIHYVFMGGVEPTNKDSFVSTFTHDTEKVKLPTAAEIELPTGYRFGRFEMEGISESINEFRTADYVQDVVIKCFIDPVYYVITYVYGDNVASSEVYNPNIGSQIPGAPVGTYYGQAYTVADGLTLKPATRSYYDFVAWTDKDGKEVKEIPVGSTGNVTLYATWKLTEYTITYEDFAPGTLPEDAVKTYTIEDNVVLPVPTLKGMKFNGWLDGNNELIEGWNAKDKSGNVVLKGSGFSPMPYTFNMIYKMSKEYQAENNISDEKAILWVEENCTATYGEEFNYDVKFAQNACNGFVPYVWNIHYDAFPVIEEANEAEKAADGSYVLVVYFSPVVMKTSFIEGKIVVTYSDGGTKTVDLSTLASVSIENGSLVYTTNDGKSNHVATVAETSTMKTELEGKITELNTQITQLKALLDSKPGNSTADAAKIAELEAKIAENLTKISTTEQQLKALQEQVNALQNKVDNNDGNGTLLILVIIAAVAAVAALAWVAVLTFKKKA